MMMIAPSPHRWTLADWDRMVERGIFTDERVELIDGEIIDMAPQAYPHAYAVARTARALDRLFGDSYWVRSQLPMRLGDRSEPEPDISVIAGRLDDHAHSGHPSSAVLIVEVSDSSLAYDRNDKASLYASHGVTDYWILNLVERQCEVYRAPKRDPEQRFGFGFSQVTIFKSDQSVSPLAMVDKKVLVADLMP